MLKTHSNSAFTFIEVMIAVLVMLVIFAGVLSVLVNSVNVWDNDMGLVELQQKTRSVLHGMSREIRQSEASAITISGSDDISFSITDEITNPSSPTTYYVRYYYDSNNSRLVRENPATGTGCDTSWSDSKCSILVADVSSVNFCCLGGIGCTDCADAHSVQVSVTTSKTVKGRTLTMPLIKKVKLRNE